MKKFLVIILFCSLLQGCINSRSKPSSFYGLKSVNINTNKNHNSINKKILINTVNIPSYIDRPQIVSVKSNKIEYIIDETNRWIEPLGILMQNAIVENMQNYLVNSTIRSFNINEKNYNYIVNVDVKKINAVLGDSIYFECIYYVMDNKQNIIINKKFTNNIKFGTDYVDFVNSLSEIVGRLVIDIVNEIKK